MRSSALVLAAAGALLALPASSQTVDEVIAKHLAARGGKEKITATTAARLTGKVLMGPGMEAPFTMEWKAPNRVRIDFQVQGQIGTQAYDGTTAWVHMPFMGQAAPQAMPADQGREMEETGDFHGPLVDYQAKGNRVELLPKTELEGTEVLPLKITLGNGSVITEYLDAESFLTILQDRKAKAGDQEIELTTSYGGYKEAGGLMLPHSMESRMKGAAEARSRAITIESYDFAAQIEDGRFVMPAAPAPEAKEPGR